MANPNPNLITQQNNDGLSTIDVVVTIIVVTGIINGVNYRHHHSRRRRRRRRTHPAQIFFAGECVDGNSGGFGITCQTHRLWGSAPLSFGTASPRS